MKKLLAFSLFGIASLNINQSHADPVAFAMCYAECHNAFAVGVSNAVPQKSIGVPLIDPTAVGDSEVVEKNKILELMGELQLCINTKCPLLYAAPSSSGGFNPDQIDRDGDGFGDWDGR